MGLFDFLKKDAAAQAAQVTEQAPVGSSGNTFGSQFSCANAFSIEPKPLDVGVKRSKELKGRIVVSGRVKGGTFTKGECVAIVGSDGVVKANTKLLDVIPDGGAVDFNTELNANMHKKTVDLGKDAWLILDVTEGVSAGDLIAKV